MGKLRLVMQSPVKDNYQTIETLAIWSTLGFDDLCMFVSENENPIFIDVLTSKLPKVCIHQIKIPLEYNHYEKRYSNSVTKISSLGKKAGPNWLFFRILNEIYQDHKQEIFLLEPDVYPINLENAANRIETDVLHNQDWWVIGAKPHLDIRKFISPSIHNHLNGAAFYKTDSEEFISFLNAIWLPSLLEGLIIDKNLAYDVLSDPKYRTVLSKSLQFYWDKYQNKFKESKLIINYSLLNIDEKLLNELQEGVSSLFNKDSFSIHVKVRK